MGAYPAAVQSARRGAVWLIRQPWPPSPRPALQRRQPSIPHAESEASKHPTQAIGETNVHAERDGGCCTRPATGVYVIITKHILLCPRNACWRRPFRFVCLLVPPPPQRSDLPGHQLPACLPACLPARLPSETGPAGRKNPGPSHGLTPTPDAGRPCLATRNATPTARELSTSAARRNGLLPPCNQIPASESRPPSPSIGDALLSPPPASYH